jgi:hypothetical protein
MTEITLALDEAVVRLLAYMRGKVAQLGRQA